MLNRKQLLSMASLVIGVTMLQTAAWAGPTTGAPGTITTKPSPTRDCYYGGHRYSEGSVIKGSDGVQVQCVGTTWQLKP